MLSSSTSTTAATNVAIVFSGILLPILLMGVVGFLTRWTLAKHQQQKQKPSNSAALSVGGLAVSSALALLAADLLWLSSLLEAYPSEATVVGTALEYIDNSWWSSHYGDSYKIGGDQYNEHFCVPYNQFALAQLRIDCPLRTCTTEVLAWDDCESRDVCRDDCQSMVDDGQGQYQCSSADGDDDGGGGDDDEDNGQWQWTEEELQECAQTSFPAGSVLSSARVNGDRVPPVVTDCTRCLSLSRGDYEWVLDQERYGVSSRWGRKRHRVGRAVGSLLGLFLGCAAAVLYRKTNGGAALDNGSCDNNDEDERQDEVEFHRVVD